MSQREGTKSGGLAAFGKTGRNASGILGTLSAWNFTCTWAVELNKASWHNSQLPFIYHPICLWEVIKRAGRTSQTRREFWAFAACLPGLLMPIHTWTAERTRKYFMSLNYTVNLRVSRSVLCDKLQITIQKVVSLNMNIEIHFMKQSKYFFCHLMFLLIT